MGLLVAYGSAIRLTLELALVTTLVLIVIGLPLSWWLARSQFWGKELVATLVAMPLVLPPTVIGFYFLIALGPNGPGGWIASAWGGRTLAFSFWGLVMGSIIYSLPFMVGPVRLAFENVSDDLLESAATLGATPLVGFSTIVLPLARPGILAGIILTFAHTVGEFGVVLMIGGNIPDQTKVLSIAIFDAVEQLNWGEAHVMALGMVVFAFAVIAATSLIDRRGVKIVG